MGSDEGLQGPRRRAPLQGARIVDCGRSCVLWQFRAQGHNRPAQDIQEREGEDWREVNAANRRDDSTERVEVGIADVEKRLQRTDSSRLGEPAQKNRTNQEVLVDIDKVAETAHEHFLREAVTGNGDRAH